MDPHYKQSIFAFNTILKTSKKAYRDIFIHLKSIEKTLTRIDKNTKADKQVNAKIEFFTKINGKTTKVDSMFLKESEKETLSIEPKDAKGHPVKIDGVPEWKVSDEDLATLEVAADGMSAVLTSKGDIGHFNVQVEADAKIGAGVKTITGQADVEVVHGDALTMEIKAGSPQAR